MTRRGGSRPTKSRGSSRCSPASATTGTQSSSSRTSCTRSWPVRIASRSCAAAGGRRRCPVARRTSRTLPPLEAAAGTLSGGTLQRLVIVREMARHPRLIIAFYPTRGLDVLSATATRELLLAARGEGAGVLPISEDLGELFSLSERLVVLYRGRIAGTFRPEQTTMNAVGFLMTGSRDAHAASG